MEEFNQGYSVDWRSAYIELCQIARHAKTPSVQTTQGRNYAGFTEEQGLSDYDLGERSSIVLQRNWLFHHVFLNEYNTSRHPLWLSR